MALTSKARLVFWVGRRKGIAVLIAARTRQYHCTWMKPPSVDGHVAVPSYPGRFCSFNQPSGYASGPPGRDPSRRKASRRERPRQCRLPTSARPTGCRRPRPPYHRGHGLEDTRYEGGEPTPGDVQLPGVPRVSEDVAHDGAVAEHSGVQVRVSTHGFRQRWWWRPTDPP